MARIPEQEVERLKKEISVQRLAEAQGVKLTRHGADLVGKCPFHDDRNPSLVITPAKNLWHCLGACNAGGTAIDWVMKAQGVSFRHAVELLKEDHFSLAATPVQPVKKSTVYIAYDRDEAGDGAAAKLAEELIEMGIECFRVQFPKGMDANEYARKVTPAAKSRVCC